MKRTVSLTLFVGLILFPFFSWGEDLGISQVPFNKQSLSTSMVYEHLKISDDFDTRGEVKYSGNVVGARIAYGISDRSSISVFGASLVDSNLSVQNSTWSSDSGFNYGVDMYNNLFPATQYWPGVQINAGVSEFQLPINQEVSNNSSTLKNQKMSGLDVHGNLLLMEKWSSFSPYIGMKASARSVDWHDNMPVNGSASNIHGTAHGNVSLVMGLPIQLTQKLKVEVEGVVFNETAISAGITWNSF